jgi:hypothetical protein
MKKYILAVLLMTLPLSAFAGSKVYDCKNGEVLVLNFQFAHAPASSLQLSNSQWDGSYRALGDGFGFGANNDGNVLFLDASLYNGDLSGTVTLPNSETTDCSSFN